jgi:hypothetical protein
MKLIYCLFLGLFAYACDSEDSSKTDLAGTQADMSAGTQTEEIPWPPQGWSEESHTKQPLGLYDQVFKLDQVQSLKIVISEATYQQMLDNLTSLLGEANQSMDLIQD